MSVLIAIIAALYIPGLIAWTKAKASGRKGAGIFQPVWDMLRLFRKGSVYSVTTSFIFQIAPTIYLATVILSLFFLPFGNQGSLLGFTGDLVFFSYLLALGKLFLMLNAMDVGSGFEGMGANREALYSMLVEPAFFILLGSFALFTGLPSIQALYLATQHPTADIDGYLLVLLFFLAAYLLVQIALIENSRLPVDDPRTHLELTMVHEVMVLDNSGFDLGLIQAASALKFAIYGTLISNFFFVESLPIVANMGIFLAVQAVFAVVIGLLESFRARNKMAKNPQSILLLSGIALLLFFMVLILSHKLLI